MEYDRLKIAIDAASFAVNNGIKLLRMDDERIINPILWCTVERRGRTDEEIKGLVTEYKNIYMSGIGLKHLDLKVRYKVREEQT